MLGEPAYKTMGKGRQGGCQLREMKKMRNFRYAYAAGHKYFP